MRKLLISAGVAASLALTTSGFAQEAPAPAQASPAVQATPAAAPAPAVAETPAPAVASAEGKGRVFFFRPTRLTGAVYTYHVVEVGDDGKPAKGAPRLGSLPNGGAFSVELEPGVRSFNITGPMAINKAEDRIRMEVEPGETYYVEQTVRMGLVTGGFRLVPADEARFKATKVKLKDVK